MKISLKLIFAVFFVVFTFSTHAQLTLNQSVTLNADGDGTNFTFNTFDSSLGFLSAVDLIIESSTIQGGFTINRTSGSGSVTLSSISARLVITGDSGSGLSEADGNEYLSNSIFPNRTPSGDQILTAVSPSRSFTINGTSQSIISSPTNVTFGGDFLLSYYVGNGISTFFYSVSNAIPFIASSTGTAGASLVSNSVLSPTTLTLQYSYAAIPEPGQVAASLLLLSGIGTYVWIKRRKATRRATS